MARRTMKGSTFDLAYYQTDQVIALFEPIVEQLVKDLPAHQSLDVTASTLSLLAGQLQQFQQDYMGILSRPGPTAPTRIPSKSFKITKPLTKRHPLFTILLATLRFRIKNNWPKWDFTILSKRNMELIHSIRSELIRRHQLQPPRITFDASVPSKDRKKLIPLIRKVEGEYVKTADEATHVLHGPLHVYEEEEEDWFRTLEKKDNKVLVHWWYYPDSYDTWLIQTEQYADPEDAPVHNGSWHLLCRWLQDSDKFNELMNEEDYEDVDDDIESTDHHKAEEDEEEIDESDDGLQHSDDGEDEDEDEDEDDEEEEEEEDKPQGRPLASKKPVPVHDPEANLPILDRSAQPRVLECDREAERIHAESIRSRKTEYEPYANGEIINLSQFTPDAYTLPYITPVTKKDVVKDEKSIELETYAHASPIKDSTLFTPSWLDLHEVHEVEKNAMPEWFSSKRRQQEYISYRNHYVQQYHASPNNYLLAMSCKQAFPSADLVQLMKIHRFLELHNIINAQIDPRRHWCNPVVDGPHDAYVSVNIPRQLDDINSSVDMGYLRRLMYDPARLKKIPSHWPFHKEPVVCNTCRISCHDLRYQHYLYHDVHVCVNCFVQGKFSMAYSSGDFIHVEGDPEEELRLLQQSQDAMDEEWTNEEILRLLEGIEKYDDDWLLVSEHVGNRTKEQCITQFLQMPITDDVLSTTLSAKEQDELPFGCTNNPIMTLVTFLTAHVNPGVGASAAKAAAKVLMQDGAAKTQDTSLPDHSTSTAKDDDEGEWVDMSMDVDPKTEPMDSQPSAEETPVEANDHEADDDYFSDQATSDALRGALKAASHQARLLSNYEDQEIQHWVRLAVKTVQDKLSLKLQQLEELDKSVHVEYMDIEDQEASILAAIDNSKKEYSTLVGNGDTPAASSSTNDSASSVPPNFAA